MAREEEFVMLIKQGTIKGNKSLLLLIIEFGRLRRAGLKGLIITSRPTFPRYSGGCAAISYFTSGILYTIDLNIFAFYYN